MTESGRLCAFITKVKRGSLADTVGHLRPGTCDPPPPPRLIPTIPECLSFSLYYVPVGKPQNALFHRRGAKTVHIDGTGPRLTALGRRALPDERQFCHLEEDLVGV